MMSSSADTIISTNSNPVLIDTDVFTVHWQHTTAIISAVMLCRAAQPALR